MTYQALTAALGAAVLALAAVPLPAPAQDASTQTEVVSFADLNLNSPEGAKAMFYRITSTAKRLCGDEPDVGEIVGFSAWRICVKDAINGAVGRLDAPLVTALNGGHATRPVMLAKAR